MISLKQCSSCKEWKDENEFHRNKREKDGLNYECKICTSKRAAKWRKNNKDRIWANTTIHKHRKAGIDIRLEIKELQDFFNITMKKGCKICSAKMEPGDGVVGPRSPSLDIKNPFKKIVDNIDDVQIICHECNKRKGNRTMKQWFDDNLDFVIKFQNDYQNWT